MTNVQRLQRITFALSLGLPPLYVIGSEIYRSFFKQRLELKVANEVVPVPPKILTLVDEVVKEISKKADAPKVIPFICEGNDLQHSQRSWWNPYVFLGIPQHYTVDEDDGSHFTAVVNGKQICRGAPEYQFLKETTCLSKEAKKYAIANALFEAQQMNAFQILFLFTIVMMKCSFLSYFIGNRQRKFQIIYTPGHHFIIHAIGLIPFVLISDFIVFKSESSSIDSSAHLGESYVQGGLEYYNKLLKRNKLIRSLYINSPYNKEGNVKENITNNMHMPLTSKLDYLKQIREGKKVPLFNYFLKL